MEGKYELPIPLNVKTAPDRDNMVFRFAMKKAEAKP
jgi:hypothetical protein